jgi:hypothetical protein
MKILAMSVQLIGIAVALLAAAALTASAEEPSPEAIDVRWVMAGMAQDADPTRPINVPPEATLRTGDKLKMYLKTRNQCYFYLFYQGPDGRLTLLYPSSLPTEALAGGTRMTIPQGDQWFELDEQTGTETFHVLVSAKPLDSIETLYTDYLKRAGENGAAARLLSAIERLRLQRRPLTSKAERPLSIGGTIRGAPDQGTGTSESRLDRLAEDITTANVFCRTYTIEHH